MIITTHVRVSRVCGSRGRKKLWKVEWGQLDPSHRGRSTPPYHSVLFYFFFSLSFCFYDTRGREGGREGWGLVVVVVVVTACGPPYTLVIIVLCRGLCRGKWPTLSMFLLGTSSLQGRLLNALHILHRFILSDDAMFLYSPLNDINFLSPKSLQGLITIITFICQKSEY